jgi:hypothetical protein
MARRKLRVSRIDFTSAWIVSILAFALYIGQAISRIQFADVFQSSNRFRSASIGFMSGGFFAGGVMLWRFRTLIKKFAWTTGAVFTILAISVLVAFGRIQPVNWKFLLAGIAFGGGTLILMTFIISKGLLGLPKT